MENFVFEQNKNYTAYFSMEFAIDQALKNYSGGLGFLAGSHMRSVYSLQQNVIGIGLLWKHGYYDQLRGYNQEMKVERTAKTYHFLQDFGFTFSIKIHGVDVHIKPYLLHPEVFKTAPMIFLSTDIPENDYISKTITHNLYDPNEITRIAQSMVLGIGGAKVLDLLHLNIKNYHLNEGHALPVTNYLFSKYKSIEKVKEKMLFTTHTPEAAGNELRNIQVLKEMSFFLDLTNEEINTVTFGEKDTLNYTLSALRLSRKANAVSKLHGEVARDMWKEYTDIAPIISITNAQKLSYWQDEALAKAVDCNDLQAISERKLALKKQLFAEVASQTGKIFDINRLTIVWARRFVGYKRADLILQEMEQFAQLVTAENEGIQIIWAGKPYPESEGDLALFESIRQRTNQYKYAAVLTGHELDLSAKLKKGADIWLNTPRITREASGTSGMSAAMNGAINFSIPDGWVAEFAVDNVNSFVIPAQDYTIPFSMQDEKDKENLFKILKEVIIPTYYQQPAKWAAIRYNSMTQVVPQFDSDRMAKEYAQLMYK